MESGYWMHEGLSGLVITATPNGSPSGSATSIGTHTPKDSTFACTRPRLDQPRRWMKPRRVFVNSMSDLFHTDVGTDFIDRIFAVMEEADRHIYQILTKRSGGCGGT